MRLKTLLPKSTSKEKLNLLELLLKYPSFIHPALIDLFSSCLVFEENSSRFHAKAIQTFQKLFQVDPEGVIPAMSQLRMNLESKSNFVKRVKVLLKMGNNNLSLVLVRFEKKLLSERKAQVSTNSLKGSEN